MASIRATARVMSNMALRSSAPAPETPPQRLVGHHPLDGGGQGPGLARRHDEGVGPVGQETGDLAHRRRHDGESHRGRLHHGHGQALVMGGQDEHVGAGQQPQGVGALARSRKRSPRPSDSWRAATSSRLRPPPDGGEPHRAAAGHDDPGRLEQHVVALLGPEVGDGHDEHAAVGHPELVAHGAPDLLAIGSQLGGTGQVDAVDDDGRPPAQGVGQRIAHRLRDRDHAVVAADGRPGEAPDDPGVLVPRVVLGVHDHGTALPGQGPDHQPPQGHGVGKVEMHDVVVPGDEQASQRHHPAQVGVARRPQRVDGDPGGTHVGHQARSRRRGRRPPRTRTPGCRGGRPHPPPAARPRRSPGT